MITIQNEQSAINVDIQSLHRQAQLVLNFLNYADYSLAIVLTTNEKMQWYNKTYRQQDKPTDVLSFPLHSDLKAGQRISAQSQEDKNLGDLIIAPEYVQHDAPRWNQSFEERMTVLLVHGICHLLGYDHIEDADYEIMQQQENWLLEKLKEVA